ncbi:MULTISPECIES: hypothetical protein [unclassified Halorubrum]|uniref:DUF7342 family protein n=1 Tax=unclassified Halorubrum TaxID=2642239 RepID=UPI0010F777D8|nr:MULTISPECIES: hypothetical protein [unclassified Halorubrum]TKX44644.1 hypothetical protein EXE50_06260 [Halorubrum sp. ARQ200]TKX48945.1 hypothetical protein EXE49_14310 [Halorubrum sp. ASP121]
MTERGLASWSDGQTARERVRAIATTLTQPRSVDWVRDEAQVSSWQTAKDELEMLAGFGQVQIVDGDDGSPRYAPNYQQRYFTELTELINDHTREELREEIVTLQAQIDDWKTAFDVESRDELEATLTDDALSSDEIRERNRILRRWEHTEDNKRLLRHALELYDDARELYTGQGDSANASNPLSQ